MSRFGKVSTAMVTPFDHKGNLDLQKAAKLVDYLIENGTESLVVAGTTGESPTLSPEEKNRAVQAGCENVRRAGAGHCRNREQQYVCFDRIDEACGIMRR